MCWWTTNRISYSCGARVQAAQAYETSKDAASVAAAKVQETAASAYETGKQYVQHGSNVAAEKAQQAGAATQDAAARTAEQACPRHWVGRLLCGALSFSVFVAVLQVRRHGSLVCAVFRVAEFRNTGGLGAAGPLPIG